MISEENQVGYLKWQTLESHSKNKLGLKMYAINGREFKIRKDRVQSM